MDIRYYLMKNPTDTAEKARYMFRVIPNGVANLNDVVTDILTSLNTTDTRVRMALAEAQKVALRHVLSGETVDFGGIRLKLQVRGSSPCEDTPFDPETDELAVCAYIDDELRDTFDGIVPVKVSASDVAASMKVSNIMDEATEQFATVIGSTTAVALGNGITFDDAGEYIRAFDAKTGAFVQEATVIGVSRGQRARFRFDPALPAGTYSLELATKGLVGEATPRIVRKPVTVLAGEAPTGPTIAKVTQAGRPDNEVLLAQVSPCTIHGTGLALGAGDTVGVQLVDAEGELLDEGDCTAKVESSADTEIRLGGFAWQNLKVPDGDWWDAYPRSKLTLVKNGQPLEFPLTFKGE